MTSTFATYKTFLFLRFACLFALEHDVLLPKHKLRAVHKHNTSNQRGFLDPSPNINVLVKDQYAQLTSYANKQSLLEFMLDQHLAPVYVRHFK